MYIIINYKCPYFLSLYIFNAMTGALFFAGTEHFASGIDKAGFRREDLSLGYLVTIVAASLFAFIATVRITVAASLGVITVTLRPKNIRLKNKIGSGDPEEPQVTPVVVEMHQTSKCDAAPSTSYKTYQPTESPSASSRTQPDFYRSEAERKSYPTSEQPEFTVEGIFQQISAMSVDSAIVSEHPLINTQPVLDHRPSPDNGFVRSEHVTHGNGSLDTKHNQSKPITDSDGFPEWLVWILRYLCCITTSNTNPPTSTSLASNLPNSPVSNTEPNHDGPTGEPGVTLKETQERDALPWPFRCCPRSIMCDCITGEVNTSRGCFHSEPISGELADTRVNLSCCGRVFPLPELCSCCFVITSSAGTAHSGNDAINDIRHVGVDKNIPGDVRMYDLDKISTNKSYDSTVRYQTAQNQELGGGLPIETSHM